MRVPKVNKILFHAYRSFCEQKRHKSHHTSILDMFGTSERHYLASTSKSLENNWFYCLLNSPGYLNKNGIYLQFILRL
ncbi:hypothetical protein EUGRSUZ_K00805 [Eucalyptus grandis]|uniref:Uncharacterized protein n=2 Tax=Eucalyptus grandis TaxID=71139 RepID=A0ACC3IRK6_EUCGR|nr:hypothetical protein EUGRSUZ_K00805 [Eucalyptus grandis]